MAKDGRHPYRSTNPAEMRGQAIAAMGSEESMEWLRNLLREAREARRDGVHA